MVGANKQHGQYVGQIWHMDLFSIKVDQRRVLGQC